jgi:hypothetical protein
MTIACARNSPDGLHFDFTTISSIVTVMMKVPLIPRVSAGA